MIKINLALLKQSNVGGEKAGAFGGTAFSAINIKNIGVKGILNDPITRKLGLMVVVAFVAGYLLDDYCEGEVAKVKVEIEAIQKQKIPLQAQVAKQKGYEELKKTYETDIQTIKMKVETIKQLVKGRTEPPRMMVTIAKIIPREVFLTDFDMRGPEIRLRGTSTELIQVSAFLKGLNENEYFKDVELKDSKKQKDNDGYDSVSFDLQGKKR